MVRGPRRQRTASEAAGWLRGIGQLALAAVLAVVLLVIVITIKHWNADNTKSPPAASVPFADAPELDLRGPILEPAGTVRSEQLPSQNQPAATRLNESLPSVNPAGTTNPTLSERERSETNRQVAWPSPASIAASPGGNPAAGRPLSNDYPSTQIPPVSIQREPLAERDAAGWNETLSVGPSRNANLPPTAPPSYRR